MIQTSCSELLVDTKIEDAGEALKKFSKLFKEVGWESSPPLTLTVLNELKDEHFPEVMVYDALGNRASLQYGDNGYQHTGFRLDSGCSDYDEKCYPIFQIAIKKLDGELISCDGGHTDGYETWAEGKSDEADNS